MKKTHKEYRICINTIDGRVSPLAPDGKGDYILSTFSTRDAAERKIVDALECWERRQEMNRDAGRPYQSVSPEYVIQERTVSEWE